MRKDLAKNASDSARNLTGTQAAGAGVNTLGGSVDNRLDSLYVGLPHPVGTSVRVGSLDAKGDSFFADITFCH